MNQIILWVVGPLVAFIVLVPQISQLSKCPKEYKLYGSMLLFALFGILNIQDWTGFLRYYQVITANLILMLVIYYSVDTWREVKVIMLSIWLACGAIVISSYLLDFNPLESDEQFRFSGLAGNANGLANFSRVGILVSLFILCTRNGIVIRLLLYISLLLFAYTVLITASRGNFINVIFIFSAFLGVSYFGGWRLFLFIILFLGFGNFIFSLTEEFLAEFYLYDRLVRNESIESLAESEVRILLYKYAWNTFIQNPIFGVGLNQFRFFSEGKISHTDFLDIAVQLGVFAAWAYMTIYYRLLKKMVMLRKVISSFFGKRSHYLLIIIFISELILGITNPNWFSQIQMVMLSMLIVIYYKVLPFEYHLLTRSLE